MSEGVDNGAVMDTMQRERHLAEGKAEKEGASMSISSLSFVYFPSFSYY